MASFAVERGPEKYKAGVIFFFIVLAECPYFDVRSGLVAVSP